MKRKKILIAAGGSGGHLYPAQQLAESLIQSADVLVAGHGLSRSDFFSCDRFFYRDVPAAPLGRTFKKLFRFFYTSLCSFRLSVQLIRDFQPDLVISFGSYHVFPLVLAAAVLRKRLSLFEANCQLGRINRFFSPFSEEIYSQFFIKNGRLVPLLPWCEKPFVSIDAKEIRRSLGLDESCPTVLVFGGSQGARFLNERIPFALKKGTWQVIHLTGKNGDDADVKEKYEEAGISVCVRPFEENMERLYRAADCAICRAGASTLAELIRFEVPSILIPFPFSRDDHQTANAKFFVENIFGGRWLKQKEASQWSLQDELALLFQKIEDHRRSLRAYKNECGKRESLAKHVLRGKD